jgi:hypothetical protein
VGGGELLDDDRRGAARLGEQHIEVVGGTAAQHDHRGHQPGRGAQRDRSPRPAAHGPRG